MTTKNVNPDPDPQDEQTVIIHRECNPEDVSTLARLVLALSEEKGIALFPALYRGKPATLLALRCPVDDPNVIGMEPVAVIFNPATDMHDVVSDGIAMVSLDNKTGKLGPLPEAPKPLSTGLYL